MGLLRSNRAYWLDLWRGLALVAMVIYHGLYDWALVYGLGGEWFASPLLFIFQQSIGLSFSVIAGISMGLSKKSLGHGVKVLVIAVVISLVTMMLMPGQAIRFGVLHMLGTSIILLSLLKPYLEKIPPKIGLLLSLGLFLAFWPMGEVGLLGGTGTALGSLPILGVVLGFPPVDFASSDYYPLLPWLGAVAFGVFLRDFFPLTPLVGEGRGGLEKGLLMAGQQALPIYLIHQPLLLAVLFPLSRFFV